MTRSDEIRSRIAAGERQVDVAKDFGISRQRVSEIARGLDRNSDIGLRLKTGALKTGGGIAQLLAGLPDPVSTWLADQTPKDATLSDTISAIITDAYHEERAQ